MRVPTKRQTTAKLFFAMGHQRRLRILDLLTASRDPLTYEQIEIATCMSQGSLSHHLRLLSEVGLIERTIKSKYSYYSPNRALLREFPQLEHQARHDLAA